MWYTMFRHGIEPDEVSRVCLKLRTAIKFVVGDVLRLAEIRELELRVLHLEQVAFPRAAALMREVWPEHDGLPAGYRASSLDLQGDAPM